MTHLESVVAGKRRLYEVSKMVLIAITCVATILILSLIGVGMNQLSDVSENTNHFARVLVDCTTPNGECYKNANRNQSGAIKNINEVTVLASYCAKQPGNTTENQIRSCIESRLPKGQ